MASSSEKCKLGLELNENCHLMIFCRESGICALSDLEQSDQELLKWRSAIDLKANDVICLHHQKKFLVRYESLQKFCIDPNRVHKKRVTREYFLNQIRHIYHIQLIFGLKKKDKRIFIFFSVIFVSPRLEPLILT